MFIYKNKMSNSHQQVYRKKIISQSMIGNNPVSYRQFGEQQQIYYSQNQIIYPGALNNQQARQVQQLSISYQVPPIPKDLKQNIYQQIHHPMIHQRNQDHQQNIYQQNQYQNIYPNKLIYPQQQIQQNNIKNNQLISNNQIIKSQNDKYYNQVSISTINKLHSEKKKLYWMHMQG